MTIQIDMAKPASVCRLFDTVRARFGRIDVVVNCAETMTLTPVAEGDVTIFDRMAATNLHGAFLVLGQTERHLSGGGRIITLAASADARSLPACGPYVAAKVGAEALVKVIVNELRGRGITVSAVAPSPVAAEFFLPGRTDTQVQDLGKQAPLERLGEPEDITDVSSFLAGRDGGRINAQVLRANGGFA